MLIIAPWNPGADLRKSTIWGPSRRAGGHHQVFTGAPARRAVSSARDGRPPTCALSRAWRSHETESPAPSATHPPRSWCTWSSAPVALPSARGRQGPWCRQLPPDLPPSDGRRRCLCCPATTPDDAVRMLRCGTRRGRFPELGRPAPSDGRFRSRRSAVVPHCRPQGRQPPGHLNAGRRDPQGRPRRREKPSSQAVEAGRAESQNLPAGRSVCGPRGPASGCSRMAQCAWWGLVRPPCTCTAAGALIAWWCSG